MGVKYNKIHSYERKTERETNMKIQTLKQSHLKRDILIAGVIVLIISAVILQFTRARYRVTESIPLVNGVINYTAPDLNTIALYVDGVSTDTQAIMN